MFLGLADGTDEHRCFCGSQMPQMDTDVSWLTDDKNVLFLTDATDEHRIFYGSQMALMSTDNFFLSAFCGFCVICEILSFMGSQMAQAIFFLSLPWFSVYFVTPCFFGSQMSQICTGFFSSFCGFCVICEILSFMAHR
jgi:hypothetical protein